MTNYYFILGRENKISQKEVEAVLANFDFGFASDAISILADDILEIKLNVGVNKIADLLKILGGTVKIYQKVAASLENIHKVILGCPEKKIIFGISNYSKSKVDTFKIAMEIKKRFGKRRPIRVIAGKDDDKLSSAQSYQYQLDCHGSELGLFETGVGKLIAVQNIDDWTRRDYGKPRSDAASGMLPPKLARMMINIALGNLRSKKPLLVDPFCGSGNILLEGLALGLDVFGADISEKAVENTKANLEWLVQNSKFKIQPVSPMASRGGNDNVKFKIFQADATKYDFAEFDRDFVIVSEPYLGRPRNHKLTIEEEKEAAAEISKLYLDFLQNLRLTGLRPARKCYTSSVAGGLKSICLVFPLYELKNGKKLSIFDRCIDFIRQIGYTLVCPPLEYGRDYQVVKRQVVLLKIKI